MRIESAPKSVSSGATPTASAAPKPAVLADPPANKSRGPDHFEPPRPSGAGIPIRITAGGFVFRSLPPRPLEPWCGTTLKPWLHRPDLFRPGPGGPCRPQDAQKPSEPQGHGIPIRLT
ncbi:hypothetical protein LY474_17165 [Myxococcus stipitatus]|uniref:hypothetical protein n=1 Tax=Myxococcus stipitatus TaxID=83455 RepID=UPI001F3B03F0|nr:hypothetical protein [Myxococcus stipitatus]MCE9669542.1 hypothetical protein [Myxococcus stipitatus]